MALIGLDERGVEGWPGLHRIGRNMIEDLRGHVGDAFEVHAGQIDLCLFLLAVHHGVAEPSLDRRSTGRRSVR